MADNLDGGEVDFDVAIWLLITCGPDRFLTDGRTSVSIRCTERGLLTATHLALHASRLAQRLPHSTKDKIPRRDRDDDTHQNAARVCGTLIYKGS